MLLDCQLSVAKQFVNEAKVFCESLAIMEDRNVVERTKGPPVL